MDYSPTMCFAGFNSKNEQIPATNERKGVIAAVYVAIKLFVSRQMPKQMAKEIYHDNISYVTT